MNDTLAKPLFTLGSTEITGEKALLLIVIVVATHGMALWVRRLTLRHFEGHDQGDEIAVKSTANLLAAIPVFVGLDVILHIMDVQLASLFAAGGILALGIGLAAKNVVANFISGVILRVDRTIRPGDVVEVHDRWMRIEKLGLRMTSAVTGRGEEVMIPNTTVAQSGGSASRYRPALREISQLLNRCLASLFTSSFHPQARSGDGTGGLWDNKGSGTPWG